MADDDLPDVPVVPRKPRAARRAARLRAIRRARRLLKSEYLRTWSPEQIIRWVGKFADNLTACSCEMCQPKRKVSGPTASERRRQERAESATGEDANGINGPGDVDARVGQDPEKPGP